MSQGSYFSFRQKEVEPLVIKIVVAGLTISASIGLAEILGIIHFL